MLRSEHQGLIGSVLGTLRATKERARERPALRWLRYAKRRVLRRSEGEWVLLNRFAGMQGYRLDLANPRTFTEKLYCRMVRWNRRVDPKFTRLTDKLAVRSYVAAKIGEQCLVKVLWQGTDPARIPFDSLPANYVIKASHGSGFIIIVKDTPPDRDEVIRSASTWLATNLYWEAREYQYFHIPRRLMVEEYLSHADASEALVYRFWCFHGAPHVVGVGNVAQSINPYYDVDWNSLEFTPSGRVLDRPPIAKPANFDEMMRVASRLSEEFDFVRVDLYNVDGKVYFSELTFTPAGGMQHFKPKEWDLKLGQLWTLRSERGEGRGLQRNS